MNPVCSQCEVEMVCKKNGVRVAHETTPRHKRSGDRFDCPVCGASVIADLGSAYTDNNNEPDVYLKG